MMGANDNEEKETTAPAEEEPDEGEEEEYAVEKIIKHRETRKGKLEYFVKWEGFSDADNTWEPQENLNCPDLVEAYEKEQRNKKEEKKSTASATKTKPDKPKEEKKGKKRKSTADDGSSGGKKKADKQNGFEKGFTAEEIIGATEDKGEVHFLIKWKEAMQDYELIPSRTVNVKIPQMVIAFYEARLTWSSANNPVEEGGEGEAKDSEEEGEKDEAPLTNGKAEVAVS